MSFLTRLTRTCGFVLLVAGLACHHASPSSLAEKEGQLIGDTTAFSPRLLGIDRVRNRVTFSVAQPAYLVLLSVAPGKSIQAVGGIPADTTITEAGKHVLSVMTQREAANQSSAWSAADHADYNRCVNQGRRALPKKTVVRRDSSGKTVTERTELEEPAREFEVERRCEAAINQRTRQAVYDLSDRYLVLLASNAPLTFMQVVARLDAITVYAEDVRSTIASIAEALYVDRRAVWSGHYMRW